ncbi:MAG: LysE family transporter [Caldilinea sp.]|nr:LysE family transporter [Caldilinea sp.]MDW8441377.1 LysE family transporter [Caldilineaceae bacterium]
MSHLLAGLTLGFAAGVSPGPLMTLVITRTLEYGLAAGLRVAVAPLITDAPIVMLTVLFVSALPSGVETALTLAGAAFLLYLAWETAHDAQSATLLRTGPAAQASAAADLWRGVMVNLLSPNPWLFWIGVGAPLFTRAWQNRPMLAIGFLASFYALLIGSKVLAAFAVAGGRRHLNDAWYRRLLFASALLLAFFSLSFFWQALKGLIW